MERATFKSAIVLFAPRLKLTEEQVRQLFQVVDDADLICSDTGANGESSAYQCLAAARFDLEARWGG